MEINNQEFLVSINIIKDSFVQGGVDKHDYIQKFVGYVIQGPN